MNAQKSALLLVFLSLFSFAAGCTKVPPKNDPNDKVLVTVNGDKITVRDMKRELALRRRQDPSFKMSSATVTQQLELVVNRRLLIQEAMRRRLAEEENFVNTIRNFWEQTLIRNLMNKMSGELAAALTVTDAEVRDYYSKLSQKVSFEVARSAQKKTIDELAEKLKKGQAVAWDEKIGPVSYEAIASPALADAFSLAPGGSKAYFENGVHYLVRVSAKEVVIPPPLDELRPKIEAQIKYRKEQQALEKWLKEKRETAKIRLVPNNPPAPAKKK